MLSLYFTMCNLQTAFNFLQFFLQPAKRGTLGITGNIYFVEVGLSNEYWQVMQQSIIRTFYREQVGETLDKSTILQKSNQNVQNNARPTCGKMV